MDIFVAPIGCKRVLQVKLPRPKDGKLQQFLYDEDNIALYEITKYSDDFRSWFLNDIFCKDGHFNILTKIDPLYMFIPHIIKFASEKFRTLQDICAAFASSDPDDANKLDYALSPDINWNQICDTKELDGELFIKFSQSKTLDWLIAKHEKTVEAFTNESAGHQSRANLILSAYDLIDKYLPSSLSDKFKNLVKNKKTEEIVKLESVKLNNSNYKRSSKQHNDNAKGDISHFFKRKDSG